MVVSKLVGAMSLCIGGKRRKSKSQYLKFLARSIFCIYTFKFVYFTTSYLLQAPNPENKQPLTVRWSLTFVARVQGKRTPIQY